MKLFFYQITKLKRGRGKLIFNRKTQQRAYQHYRSLRIRCYNFVVYPLDFVDHLSWARDAISLNPNMIANCSVVDSNSV